MARPIRPTPPLYGHAAKRFLKVAANPKPCKVPTIDWDKLASAVKRVAEKHAAK